MLIPFIVEDPLSTEEQDTLFTISGDITIITPTGNSATISRGGLPEYRSYRFFNIQNGGSLHLENVILTGGRIWVTNPNVEADWMQGGAIYNSGLLSLENTTLIDNRATHFRIFPPNLNPFNIDIVRGGSLYNAPQGRITTISNTTFQDNSAQGSGVLLSIAGDAQGGAIYNDGIIENITDNVQFINNFAEDADLPTILDIGLIGGNGYGGAIYNNGTIQNITDNILFEGNIADSGSGTAVSANGFGGAIYNNNLINTIEESIFAANIARGALGNQGLIGSGFGGAIYNNATIRTITGNNQFVENQATGNLGLLIAGGAYGGAIYNAEGASIEQLGDANDSLNFTGNTVTSNFGIIGNGTRGGAIYNAGNITAITNNLYFENAAHDQGVHLVSGTLDPSLREVLNIIKTLVTVPSIFFPDFTDRPDLQLLAPPGYPGTPIGIIRRTVGILVDICDIPAVNCGRLSNILIPIGANSEGGAIYNDGYIGSLTTSTFTGNLAHGGSGFLYVGGDGSGGAIYNDVSSEINRLRNNNFSENLASGDIGSERGGRGRGGSIFNAGLIRVDSQNTYTGNEARGGLGFINTIFLAKARWPDPGPNFNITPNVPQHPLAFCDNSNPMREFERTLLSGGRNGLAQGGAIYNAPRGILHIADATFTDNVVTSDYGFKTNHSSGGAIYNVAFTPLEVVASDFTNNIATGGSALGRGRNGRGGAIYLEAGTLIVRNSTFTANLAEGSVGLRGISYFKAFTNIQNTICPWYSQRLRPLKGIGGIINLFFIYDSPQHGEGGAIAVESGRAVVRDSNFIANQAFGGFGMYGGDARGGGLYNHYGDVFLIGNTWEGNEAVGGSGFTSGYGQGGALFNFGGSIQLTNNRFTDNVARVDDTEPLIAYLDTTYTTSAGILDRVLVNEIILPDFVLDFLALTGLDAVYNTVVGEITDLLDQFLVMIDDAVNANIDQYDTILDLVGLWLGVDIDLELMAGHGQGGAVYNRHGIIILADSNLTGNSAIGGGGDIYISGSAQGGAIYNTSNFYVPGFSFAHTIDETPIPEIDFTIPETTFSIGVLDSNITRFGRNDGRIIISGSVIEGNSVITPAGNVAQGGGIYNRGTMRIVDATLAINSANVAAETGITSIFAPCEARGGAVANELGGRFVIHQSAIINNRTGNELDENCNNLGAGIYTGRRGISIYNIVIPESVSWLTSIAVPTIPDWINLGDLPDLSDLDDIPELEPYLDFLDNPPFSDLADLTESLDITDVTDLANIINDDETYTFIVQNTHSIAQSELLNTTISGNEALEGFGGAIYNDEITLATHITAIDNESTSGRFVYNDDDIGVFIIKNALIDTEETVPTCTLIEGEFRGLGVNIGLDSNCETLLNHYRLVDFLGVARLRLNVPGTTVTHALRPSSPALQASTDCTTIPGTRVRTDQRGVARERVCDVGAYESNPFISANSSGGDDLQITKFGAINGNQITWIIQIINVSDSTLTDVLLLDVMSETLSIESIEFGNAVINYAQEATLFEATYAQIESGQILEITVTTDIITQAQEYINTACVTADEVIGERCVSAYAISQLPNTGQSLIWWKILKGLAIFLISGTFIIVAKLHLTHSLDLNLKS